MRKKAIYFRDAPGFVLTFPEDDGLYERVRSLSSADVRRLCGFDTLGELRLFAGSNVRRAMRDRLRERLPQQERVRPERPAPTRRETGWPARDEAAAARAREALEAWAPEAACVLDPFAGTGACAIAASRRGAAAFWCESDPVRRFLAAARFRALYREDDAREELRDEAEELAASLELHASRAPEQASLVESLRWVAEEDESLSRGVREILRTAVVSLFADEEDLSLESVADQIARVASHVTSHDPLLTFPSLLAPAAPLLLGMRSVAADVLLTNLPALGATASAPAAAAEFLGVRGFAETTAEVRRGRATGLQLDAALRELGTIAESQLVSRAGNTRVAREAVAKMAATVAKMDEPGKAATAAAHFARLLRSFAAIEGHLAGDAIAILEVEDAYFGGTLVHTDDHVADVLAIFGFLPLHSETLTARALPLRGEVPERDREKQRRRVVLRRRRPPEQTRGWAMWA